MDKYCTMSTSTKVIKKKKKLKSATKFFICFRWRGPAGTLSATGGKPVFTCVAVGDKDAAAVEVYPVPVASKEGYHQPQNGGGTQQTKKEQRKIYRVLKAILFETSLVRKIRTKRGYESSSLRYNHLSSSEEDDPKRISKRSSSLSSDASIFTKSPMNSSSSSSSLRGSCPSLSTTPSRTSNSRTSLTERIKSLGSAGSSITSLKANSKCLSDRVKSFRSNSSLSSKTNSTLSERTKSFRSNSNINLEEIRHANDEANANYAEEQRQGASYPSNMGLCFLLMSLLGLVFWGKICGIVCASTWLFSLPFWSFGCHHSSPVANKVVEPPKIDSLEDHKKKVVMGGLLARLPRPARWR